jgi:hypothetical protein
MGWFRSSRRGAARLVLFALACEFVASFGHVHFASLISGSAAWANSIRVGENSPAHPQLPQKQPNGLPGDLCAICANIALAGTLLVPDWPVSLVPISLTQNLLWPKSAGEPATSSKHLTFDARGPPYP